MGFLFHVIALIAIQLQNWQKHQFHAAAEQSSSAKPLRNQQQQWRGGGGDHRTMKRGVSQQVLANMLPIS